EKTFDPQGRAVPPPGSLVEPIEGAPHAVRLKIGVVAEADAHRHQRKGNRKTEKNDEDEQPEHQEGDLGIRHALSPDSSACFSLIRRASVSSTSSSASIQKPSRMQWMQRKTWAIPWMNRRIPAAT